eukprot:TRINITY_DN51133_c0_g1_i1.p1 TRINITY_DN51133_c0_g1~~TRINITY_DN51133_c0_g1_i1.p1  ORF type:complete len:390 (-),score=41.04 TRINITY_DN51133_c0_g1_i1:134-1303(-)
MEFIATVGSGLDLIAKRELAFYSLSVSHQYPGKILFSVNDATYKDTASIVSQIVRLRTVERVMLLVSFKELDDSLRQCDNMKEVLKRLCILFLEPNWKLHVADADQLLTNCAKPHSPEPPKKRQKKLIRFRISLRFSGKRWAKLDSARLVRQLGVMLVAQQDGWVVDLKQFDFEIVVHLNNFNLMIAIPLKFNNTPLLADRPYLKHFGLRSTVAAGMAQLAEIQDGEVVLDPMCGVGICLLEAYHVNKRAIYFGADQDSTQLHKCTENISLLHDIETGWPPIFILQSVVGANNLSFRKNVVDVLISDLPFGNKHKPNDGNIADMYRQVVGLMEVLMPRRSVLLVGGDGSGMLEVLPPSFVVQEKCPLDLGQTKATLLVADRASPRPQYE